MVGDRSLTALAFSLSSSSSAYNHPCHPVYHERERVNTGLSLLLCLCLLNFDLFQVVHRYFARARQVIVIR